MPIIFSHPSSEVSMEYLTWEKDTLEFVQRHFHGKVEAVARHSDESRLHLHALIHEGGRRVLGLSPGHTAEGKRSVKSLRKFQDLYHEEVSRKNKLTRLGPKRLRVLSTREHKESVEISGNLERDIRQNQAVIKRQQAEIEMALQEEAGLSRRRARMKSRIEAETTELQFLIATKEGTARNVAQREANVLAKEQEIEQFLQTLDEHELAKVKAVANASMVKRFTGRRSP